MISHGAYTTSPLVVQVLSSLGNLKTFLCASSIKIKCFSKTKTKTQCKEAPLLPIEGLSTDWLDDLNVPNTRWTSKKYPAPLLPIEGLSTDWLDDLNVPNTRWTSKKYPLHSLEWKQSYISAESFLYNKHDMVLSHGSQVSPFYFQQMVTKKKPFLQHMQRRYKSTYTSTERILSLEKTANREHDNPKVQAEYLKSIVNEDPDYVIRRCKSGQYASSKEVTDIFMTALLLTNQISSSGVGNKGDKNSFNVSTDNHLGGTKDQPLHVVMNDKRAGSRKFLWFNVALVIFCIYYLKKNGLKIMPDFTGKEILPDQSEQKVKFEDVQGCNEAKEELQEVVQYLQSPEMFESLGAKLPCGVLLIGPPGTGKTLLARAIAGEADVPFYFVSGSEFDEMFVGVGAARIRKLFASAKEHSPCIIFIDELDAIGGKRVATDHQPYSRMTLNQLLVELDGFNQKDGVIVIGATNFPEVLDKALIRPGRFDSKVYVTIPDVRGRIDILKLYLKKTHCDDDVDAEVIAQATPGFTGADLSNLVNQSALRAASLQLPLITMEHFEWARDKISMGPERKSRVIAKEDRILTAYHEGGHAIVAIFTEDADKVHKATIMPRGDALGYVEQLPEKDQLNFSRKQLLAKMDVCMGGIVAEEMVFGKDSVTTGSSSDMQTASKIARAMVTKYGMSDKVGTVLIDEQGDEISPELQNIIESEVKRLIEEAYIHAKDVLNEHSEEHKRLAEALLKYETLNSKEIDLVIKGLPLQNI